MLNKKIMFIFLLSFMMISLSSACSCIYLENTKMKLDNAEYVFSGEALEIKKSKDNMQEITIKTIQYWKPAEFPESINLKVYATEDNGANCGYNFEKGQKYVIYSYLNSETGKLSTNSCMGNSLAFESIQEISELNNLTNSTLVDYNYEKDQNDKPKNKSIILKFFGWLKNLFR